MIDDVDIAESLHIFSPSTLACAHARLDERLWSDEWVRHLGSKTERRATRIRLNVVEDILLTDVIPEDTLVHLVRLTAKKTVKGRSVLLDGADMLVVRNVVHQVASERTDAFYPDHVCACHLSERIIASNGYVFPVELSSIVLRQKDRTRMQAAALQII